MKSVWFLSAMILPSYYHGYVTMFPVFQYFRNWYALFFAVNHWTLDAGFLDSNGISNSNWGILQVKILSTLHWIRSFGHGLLGSESPD